MRGRGPSDLTRASGSVSLLADCDGVAVGTPVDLFALRGEVVPAAIKTDPNSCVDNHQFVRRRSDVNTYWIFDGIMVDLGL